MLKVLLAIGSRFMFDAALLTYSLLAVNDHACLCRLWGRKPDAEDDMEDEECYQLGTWNMLPGKLKKSAWYLIPG
jgi:hypothetical protein